MESVEGEAVKPHSLCGESNNTRLADTSYVMADGGGDGDGDGDGGGNRFSARTCASLIEASKT